MADAPFGQCYMNEIMSNPPSEPGIATKSPPVDHVLGPIVDRADLRVGPFYLPDYAVCRSLPIRKLRIEKQPESSTPFVISA
jgi:hypothetical protein